MNRTQPLHRSMARLALVAMLLLASLPTIGRLAQGAGHESGSTWGAMCTAAGLQVVAVPLFATTVAPADHHDAGDGGHPHGGPDCDYCPLLRGLLAVATCVLLLLPQTLRSVSSDLRLVAVRPAFHPCGLGSRGPPRSP